MVGFATCWGDLAGSGGGHLTLGVASAWAEPDPWAEGIVHGGHCPLREAEGCDVRKPDRTSRGVGEEQRGRHEAGRGQGAGEGSSVLGAERRPEAGVSPCAAAAETVAARARCLSPAPPETKLDLLELAVRSLLP